LGEGAPHVTQLGRELDAKPSVCLLTDGYKVTASIGAVADREPQSSRLTM
jgi:hypothetical protein